MGELKFGSAATEFFEWCAMISMKKMYVQKNQIGHIDGDDVDDNDGDRNNSVDDSTRHTYPFTKIVQARTYYRKKTREMKKGDEKKTILNNY